MCGVVTKLSTIMHPSFCFSFPELGHCDSLLQQDYSRKYCNSLLPHTGHWAHTTVKLLGHVSLARSNRLCFIDLSLVILPQ